MRRKNIELGIIKLCLLGMLSGCAGTPEVKDDTYTKAQLNNESLDVLFATEFPVDSEEDALARADFALNEGDVDKALFFYIRALLFNPENVQLLSHIGNVQMQREYYAKAKLAYLLAKQYDPTYSIALEGLGLIYMVEGMNAQAKIEFEAAIANNDRLWRSHNALGVYADKSSNYLAAQDHYNAALLINPKAASVLNNRGYSKFLAGDSDGAMLDLYEAAFDRGFSQAWANLGMVYANQGWYEDALVTYQNVMSDAHAYNNTGEIALRNGAIDEAERFLNEAIILSPTYFPEAERNLRRLAELNSL